jgi:hypothetical protein
MRLKLSIAMSSIVMLVACCGTASAATFTLGQTDSLHQPSVAVDANGNAYVAWSDPVASGTTQSDIAVCEIPAGTTTCSKQDLSFPSAYDEGENPHVFIQSDGTVLVVASGQNGAGSEETYYSSNNEGGTWTANTGGSIGNLNWTSAAYDPSSGIVYGASNNYSGANIAVNAGKIGAADEGDDVNPNATLVPSGQGGSANTSSAVSDTAAGVSVVHVWDGGTASAPGGASWGYYDGPALNAASNFSTVIDDVGSASNWKVGSLADGGTGLSLVGGPAGIFLAEKPRAGSGLADGLLVRTFEGGTTGFSGAAGIDCADTSKSSSGIQGDSLSEDPSTGALQAIYIEGDYGYEAVRYTELASGKQSPPVTIETSTGNALLSDPYVATDGTGHPGLAIWLQAGQTNQQVEATWLPAVSLTGCPTTPPGGGLTQTQSTTENGQQITLAAPAATTCTASTGLSVTLTSKTIKALAKKGPKFANAQFFIDKGVKHTKKVKVKGKHGKVKYVKKTYYSPNKTAKRLPANETFSTKGLKVGNHTLTVKVHFTKTSTLTVGHGKHKRKVKTTVTITRTLKATFKVC